MGHAGPKGPVDIDGFVARQQLLIKEKHDKLEAKVQAKLAAEEVRASRSAHQLRLPPAN